MFSQLTLWRGKDARALAVVGVGDWGPGQSDHPSPPVIAGGRANAQSTPALRFIAGLMLATFLSAPAQAGAHRSVCGVTPQGWRITLARLPDPDPALVEIARHVGKGGAFLEQADNPALSWFKLAIENPDSFAWGRGQTIALRMRNGSLEFPRMFYGVAEWGDIVWLGNGAALERGVIRRVEFGQGAASLLFAAYRSGLPQDSVDAVIVTRSP